VTRGPQPLGQAQSSLRACSPLQLKPCWRPWNVWWRRARCASTTPPAFSRMSSRDDDCRATLLGPPRSQLVRYDRLIRLHESCLAGQCSSVFHFNRVAGTAAARAGYSDAPRHPAHHQTAMSQGRALCPATAPDRNDRDYSLPPRLLCPLGLGRFLSWSEGAQRFSVFARVACRFFHLHGDGRRLVAGLARLLSTACCL